MRKVLLLMLLVPRWALMQYKVIVVMCFFTNKSNSLSSHKVNQSGFRTTQLRKPGAMSQSIPFIKTKIKLTSFCTKILYQKQFLYQKLWHFVPNQFLYQKLWRSPALYMCYIMHYYYYTYNTLCVNSQLSKGQVKLCVINLHCLDILFLKT